MIGREVAKEEVMKGKEQDKIPHRTMRLVCFLFSESGPKV